MPSAARRITLLPASVDPVKETFRTSGWATSAAPVVSPGPGRTWNAPGGTPASSASSQRRSAESGVSLAGLTITVLPIARAGAIFQVAIANGKFQGTIRAQTPSGSRNVTLAPRAETGIVAPPSRRDRLPRVAAFDPRELVGRVPDPRGEPEENRGAILRRAPLPVAAVGGVREAGRAVHVFGGRLRHRRDRLARRRIEDEAARAERPLRTLAPHEKERLRHRGCPRRHTPKNIVP